MSETRRKFLNVLIGGGLVGWLGSVLYPVFSFLKPPEIPEASVNSINAGPASDFPLNSGQIVKFGRTPVMLVRTEAGDFRAFGGTCTHLDCIVQYRDDIKHLVCACHNGHFDLQGRNISGPPPRPLPAFTVNVVEGEVIVSKPEQAS